MARVPQLNLTLFLLTACAGNKATRTADDDTGASGVDTDTSAPVAGCITLNEAGDFASLTEALSAAGEGDTIGLCAGDFEESACVEIPVLIQGAGAVNLSGLGLDGPGQGRWGWIVGGGRGPVGARWKYSEIGRCAGAA